MANQDLTVGFAEVTARIMVQQCLSLLSDFIEEHGGISDREIEALLGLKKTRAFTVAKQMRDEGLIQAVGRGDNKKYILL